MAKTASVYPNFAAEMTRSQLDYGTLYEALSKKFGKSTETVANWFTNRANQPLPTSVAFDVRDTYFPTLTVDYLFGEEPITPDERIPARPTEGEVA